MRTLLSPSSPTSGSQKDTAKIKLGVVDDHQAFRAALTEFLQAEPDFDIVLSAKDGSDLLEKLNTAMPDIILMDMRMPNMNGPEATRHILSKYPAIKIMAHTQYDNDENIIEMYRLGVKSFICKESDPMELITAIRAVHKGGNYVTDAALSIFKNHLDVKSANANSDKSSHLEGLSMLSSIERKVLWHTASIKTVKQIAKELHLSPHTVNNHQANIRKKLNLFGRNALTLHAVSTRNSLKEWNFIENE